MSLKISHISDVHSEFYKGSNKEKLIRKLHSIIKKQAPDVVVYSGDMARADLLVLFLDAITPENVPYIIFVTGNHEYYNVGMNVDEANSNISHDTIIWNQKNPGRTMTFLDDSSFNIAHKGVVYNFIGGTLWTDQNLYGNPVGASLKASAIMNDYRCISGLTVGDTIHRHGKTLDYITGSLKKTENAKNQEHNETYVPFSGKQQEPVINIVVTHHLPTGRIAPERFHDDALSPSFASNLEYLMIPGRKQKCPSPELWICGHSHGAKTALIGKTLVSVRTYGYPGEGDNARNKTPRLLTLGSDRETFIMMDD